MNYVDKEYIINEEGMIVEEIEKPDDMKVNKETEPEKNKSSNVFEIGIDNF